MHWEEEFALEVGAPGAYDYGPERCSWLAHHLTNWMGDDGFLRRATCKIRRHNPGGDILFINGTVKRKYVEDGRHLVEIEQVARNQDDELSILGTGVVELPSREARLPPTSHPKEATIVSKPEQEPEVVASLEGGAPDKTRRSHPSRRAFGPAPQGEGVGKQE